METKLIGLFFSASWSPPNQDFLEILKPVYKEACEKNLGFEIVFISFDDNEAEYNQNYLMNHGNWLLWPFTSKLTK